MPGGISLRWCCLTRYSQCLYAEESRCCKEPVVRARPACKVTCSCRPRNPAAEEPEYRWGGRQCGGKGWLGRRRNLRGWGRRVLKDSSQNLRLVEVDFGSAGSTSVRTRRQRPRSEKCR